ncbi:MAG TPA: VanZ family protein [Pyrinomonadaceae bacterium]|jgi:VanZ family protein
MTKQPSWIREEAHSSTRQRLRRYGPLLLWLVFISLASTAEFSAANTSRLVRPLLLWLFPNISEARLAAAHFLTRKAAHFTEYAVLAFLARRAFITSSHAFIQRLWFQLAFLLVVIYALVDEFHQSFVPSRTASIYDSVIDVGGGLTILLILKFYGKDAQRREAQVAPLG